jgi:hypothetical protein
MAMSVPGAASLCDYACPEGWTPLSPGVCCTARDGGAQCFSQATGPAGGGQSPAGSATPTALAGVACGGALDGSSCQCSGTFGGTSFLLQCSNTTEVGPGKYGQCSCTSGTGGNGSTTLGVTVCPAVDGGNSLGALTDFWIHACGFPD